MRTEEARNITAPPTVFWKGSITFHYGKITECGFFIFEFNNLKYMLTERRNKI